VTSWAEWLEGLAPDVREAIEEGLKAEKTRKVKCPSCGKRVTVQVPDVEGRVRAARALREVVEAASQGGSALVVQRVIIRPEENVEEVLRVDDEDDD
jgi:DNA-directed RNA polymerase subunit RPC12/RpoP